MDKHLANGGKPNWGSAWGAGDIMYANIDGKDGVNSGANTVNDHGDLKIIGNSTPRYNFGLTLDGSWKGLDFSLFIQGVMKRDYMLDGPYFWGANGQGNEWQSTGFATSTIGVLKATHWEQTPMPTIRNHTSAAIKTKKRKAVTCKMQPTAA